LILIGNLPENFIDEEALKTFLNTVIAKGDDYDDDDDDDDGDDDDDILIY